MTALLRWTAQFFVFTFLVSATIGLVALAVLAINYIAGEL